MLIEKLLMFCFCVGTISFTLLGIYIYNLVETKKKKRMDDNNHDK